MSNRPVPEHDYEEISFDEATRFLRGISEERSCHACGQTGWDIPVESDDSDNVKLSGTGLHYEDGERMALAIACRNCGYIRYHDADRVLQWLSDNAKKDGDSDE